jgi:hypothetical protein
MTEGPCTYLTINAGVPFRSSYRHSPPSDLLSPFVTNLLRKFTSHTRLVAGEPREYDDGLYKFSRLLVFLLNASIRENAVICRSFNGCIVVIASFNCSAHVFKVGTL